MSGFGRGPNVSQYIANLNAVVPPQQHDPLAFDEDLALFSNTDLFDFDLGNVKHDDYVNAAAEAAGKEKADGKAMSAVEYANAASFNMFDPSHAMMNNNYATANFDPQLYQSPQSATFPQPQPQPQQQLANSASPSDSAAQGQKRSHSVSSPAGSTEDPSRHAAEEDKRRRNTAASARFRVKKKQREAALEKTAKDNAERVDNLQKRVTELEMENKWLRELVVQKSGKETAAAHTDTNAVPSIIANKQTKKGVGTEASS